MKPWVSCEISQGVFMERGEERRGQKPWEHPHLMNSGRQNDSLKEAETVYTHHPHTAHFLGRSHFIFLPFEYISYFPTAFL